MAYHRRLTFLIPDMQRDKSLFFLTLESRVSLVQVNSEVKKSRTEVTEAGLTSLSPKTRVPISVKPVRFQIWFACKVEMLEMSAIPTPFAFDYYTFLTF